MIAIMDKLVSIIVPIYNVEKFLNRCIESLVRQTYRNIEIILIDDESPDQCPEICNEWSSRDSRIKVIHKQNEGLGYARNTGIDHAEGDYIFFVDSDDYIADDTVEKVMLVADETDADIIQFGSFILDINGNIIGDNLPRMNKEFYKDEEILNVILPSMIAPGIKRNNFDVPFNACSKAFSRNLIQRNNWRFVSERQYISEDHFSILCLMKDVKSFSIISEPLYYRYTNNGSLSHVFRIDRYEKQKYFYKACLDKCDELKYSQEIKDRLSFMHMNDIIWILRMYYYSNLPVKVKKIAFRNIIYDNNLQDIISKMDISQEGLKKWILYYAIRRKWTTITYWLLKIRYKT